MNILNKKQGQSPKQELGNQVKADFYGQNAQGTPHEANDITIPTGIEPGV